MSVECIHIRNLSKRYTGSSKDSLSNVNLQINHGDKFGILGPNGAGKTTLISILCGIIQPSVGTITYWNDDSLSPKELKKKLGYVPQEYAFYHELTPLQNLEYFGAMYRLSSSAIKSKSEGILNVLGLDEVKNKKINTFSGGMKRRVNLAIGIIHNPQILFLDEPTVGVDIQSKAAIIRFLNELNKNGTTIIYTSHHLSEAQDFCTKIALIDHGEIITTGETKQLLFDNNVNSLEELLINFTGASYRD